MKELEKKKRYRRTIGQIFQIPLGDGTFSYGQVISSSENVFFDYRDRGDILYMSEIVSSNKLFVICVDDYVLRKGVWKVLGKFTVKDVLIPDQAFYWDNFNKRYLILRDGVGHFFASFEDVKNLECLSSWGHVSVEQRLRDHFAGRPNYDYVKDRNQHDPNFPDRRTFYKRYGYDLILDDSFDKANACMIF
jgi:Immunity protein 26